MPYYSVHDIYLTHDASEQGGVAVELRYPWLAQLMSQASGSSQATTARGDDPPGAN